GRGHEQEDRDDPRAPHEASHGGPRHKASRRNVGNIYLSALVLTGALESMPVESRKVQKVGTSTLSVSLHKEWAEKQGVEKGDILMFEDLRDGSLRIAPSKLGGPRIRDAVYVINADLATDKGMLGRIVVGNYVIGRNHLVIRSKTRIKSEHIREVRE